MDEFIAYVRKIEQQASSKKQKSDSECTTDKDDSDKGSKNKGHLIVDATVAPSDIKYPTDLDLLNEAREKSEALIDMLYVPEKGKVKPRTYRQKVRKEYLSFAKQRKKRKKTIRKALKKQLGYVHRNFKTIKAVK